MLAKRIIPCLDVKNGRNVRGVKFSADRDAGDPVELATRRTALSNPGGLQQLRIRRDAMKENSHGARP